MRMPIREYDVKEPHDRQRKPKDNHNSNSPQPVIDGRRPMYANRAYRHAVSEAKNCQDRADAGNYLNCGPDEGNGTRGEGPNIRQLSDKPRCEDQGQYDQEIVKIPKLWGAKTCCSIRSGW